MSARVFSSVSDDPKHRVSFVSYRRCTVKRTNWINVVGVLSIATLGACSNQSGQAAENKSPAKTGSGSVTRFVASGSQFAVSTIDTISSRTAREGDSFGATVLRDVEDASGRVAIPSGSVVYGTVVDVKSSPSPGNPGTLTLAVSSVTVRGSNYPIEATIDSIATERQGRGITGGDAAKVGVGAAAGAIVGQIIGKNPRGTIIGAAAGAAAGAGYAAATKDSDVRVPAGTHIIVTLRQRLAIAGN